MKKLRLSVRGLTAIILFSSGYMCGFGKKPFFRTRSQAVNAPRELVGWQEQIHIFDIGDRYGSFSVTPEYNRSFHAERIADQVLGGEVLRFSGSRVADRGESDILADYFGLPQDFESKICFSPHISNFLIDFNWFFGFEPGMFFRVHVPLVHTNWNLFPTEVLINSGGFTDTALDPDVVVGFPAGYMGPERILRSDLPECVLDFMNGRKTFGDMQEALKYGKIFGRQTGVRIAEIQAELGWNFIHDEDYRLGLAVRAAFPTGNRPDGEFLFDALIGNGKHWEVGGTFTGEVILRHNENAGSQLALYWEVNVTHLFKTKHKRSYDFKDAGVGSRYMLLTKIFVQDPANLIPGAIINLNKATDTPSDSQYQRRILPAINVTTLDTEISIAAQVDLAIKFGYFHTSRGVGFDIGYNLWAHSKEKLHCRERFPDNIFALKGDAQVYGFSTVAQAGPPVVPINSPVPLNATQSETTLFKGQGDGNFVAGAEYTNANADNPVNATDASDDDLFQLPPTELAALNVVGDVVQLSNPAILLTDKDIDECGALLPRALTHKIFAHVHHVWQEFDGWIPFAGVGAHVEWACRAIAQTGCTDSCPCNNSAHSQWAVWLKGGLSF